MVKDKRLPRHILYKKRTMVQNFVAIIIRVFIGFLLIIPGADKIYPFITHPETTEKAARFKAALTETGYFMQFTGLTEIMIGALVLSGRFKLLTPVLFFPLSLNLILYHLFLDPKGIVPAMLLYGYNLYLFWEKREIYREFFKN